MKNTIITTVIFLVFISCQNKAETAQKNMPDENREALHQNNETDDYYKNIYFIGYNKKLPVFYNREKNILLISKKTGELNLFMQIEENHYAEYINDNWLLLSKGKELIMKNLADESLTRNKTLGVNKDIGYAVCNSDLSAVVFTEEYSVDVNIYYPDKELIKKLNIKGSNPYFINNFMFYYKYDDGMNGNIYSYNISTNENKTVVNNFTGDPIVYSPKGDFVVGFYNELKEDFPHVIYNVNSKKYNLIDKEPFFSEWCYYSYQENAMVFYTNKEFKTKIVALPPISVD